MKTIHIDHSHAQDAIIAASNRHNGQHWGRYASIRYAINRGVPMRLYVLACQLAAATKGGF